MARKEPIRAVKGMRDILPGDSVLWEHIEEVARQVFRSYAYDEIRTPLVEPTELFVRGVGTDTDIVTKEMYSWEDYESHSLSICRKWILSEGLFGASPQEFQKLVVRFLDLIDSGLRDDMVPKSASNLKSIIDLRMLVAQLSELLPPIEFTKTKEAIKAVTLILSFGPELSLRPEATAPVIRAYIEHRMWEARGLVKVYYMGPMFRRERPQKGRYRQFYQIGAEAIGMDHFMVDAEMIDMAVKLLKSLNLTGFSLLLNSVGCKECRPKYLETLRAELAKVRYQLCEDCRRRSETNPLRVLDCKVPEDQPVIDRLPTITDSLCEACKTHFDNLKAYLHDMKIEFTLEKRLVRGLDYYTRTTFEVVHGSLGAQNSLLGGGRYDGLSEELGGPSAPGVGFSIGEDRLASVVPPLAKKPLLFIAWLGERGSKHAQELGDELRRQKIVLDVYQESLRPKKFFELASRLAARHDVYALLIGDREVDEGKYQVKDMTQGKQLNPMTKEELKQFLEEKEKASQAQ
jgi:histidyl-tRNA synthetase